MTLPSIRLRPFDRDDFPALLGWVDSPEFLMQWAGRNFLWPLDTGQLEAYLAEAHTDPPLRYLYSAVAEPGGPVLGHIGLRDINRIDRAAMVSCVAVGDPAGRGRGVGTAMMERICAIGFDELGLHRLELYVFDFNARAIACYERVGFRIEGLLRDKRRLGDQYWSPYLMSLLEPEWRLRHRPSPAVGTPPS